MLATCLTYDFKTSYYFVTGSINLLMTVLNLINLITTIQTKQFLYNWSYFGQKSTKLGFWANLFLLVCLS